MSRGRIADISEAAGLCGVPSPPPLRDVLHALGEHGADCPGVLDVDVIDARAITTFQVPTDVAAFYGHHERFFEEDEPTFA